MKPIINACNRSIGNLSSGLPDVGAAIMEILMPCKASYVQKQQVSGYTQEVLIEIITKVSIQPSDEPLNITNVGERIWKHFTIYALNNLDLNPDEVFTIKGINYRIMSKKDWKEYGFIHYETVEDFKMSAPDPTEGSGYVT
jgi:hypothetical protein